MKRWMLTAGTLLAAGGLALWIRLDHAVAKADGVTVTWEAEADQVKIEAPFRKKQGSYADKQPKPKRNSGTGWVDIPAKSNGGKKATDSTSLPGYAKWKVNIPQTGNYTMWARVLWPNGCGNSFYVQREDRPKIVLGQDGTYDAWHWIKLKSKLSLTKGVNVIKFLNREDGVAVDEIQVTTTDRYPVGSVPQSSNALSN